MENATYILSKEISHFDRFRPIYLLYFGSCWSDSDRTERRFGHRWLMEQKLTKIANLKWWRKKYFFANLKIEIRNSIIRDSDLKKRFRFEKYHKLPEQPAKKNLQIAFISMFLSKTNDRLLPNGICCELWKESQTFMLFLAINDDRELGGGDE